MKIDEIFSVKNKVAVVTGGSRGIGEMIASAYLANEATVYITSRKADVCDAKAIELSEKYNAQCTSLPSDLSSLEGIEKFVNEVEALESGIDILVNNAGTNPSGGSLLDVELSAVQKTSVSYTHLTLPTSDLV